MAGHSKWANIRHRKARVDSKRSKAWSKCSRALIVAARNGGGDPAMNLSLRYAIDEAKAANMPKDTIQKAVDKGAGDGEGVAYEELRYEGYGPNGVAIMVDVLTDNRNRAAGDIRRLFDRGGGSLGATGCVSYIFNQLGQIYIDAETVTEDQVMEAALEAGADDVQTEEGAFLIVTDPSEFITVREALETAGLELASAEITMVPDNTVACTGSDAEKVLRLLENLEDNDDVQKVYSNEAIDPAELESLQG